jgi:hypothetical protein
MSYGIDWHYRREWAATLNGLAVAAHPSAIAYA